MKKITLLILFTLLTFQCAKRDYKYKNTMDPFTPRGLFTDLVIWPAFYSRTTTNSGQFNSSTSTSQPSNIFGYSDRIIVTSDSYSSTPPIIWVSTNGSDFTKYSVKIGDCVGSNTSTGNTGCRATLVGYENGSYMILGQKFTNAPGSQTTDAQYYGTGTDLNTITLATTNIGIYTANLSSNFIYLSGKSHIAINGTTGNALLSTSDGVTWSTLANQNCTSLYRADNGNPTCGLVKTFNGTSWVNAGTITGGPSSNSGNFGAVYLDSAYRAWNNNSGTLSIYKSTAGTITGGITFPAGADGNLNLSGITNNPPKLEKISTGVYLIFASNYINNVFTYSAVRSTDGTNWSTITPIFPTDLGTIAGIYGYTTLGDKFYAVFSFKVGTMQSQYLLSSTDGITWTKVTLP